MTFQSNEASGIRMGEGCVERNSLSTYSPFAAFRSTSPSPSCSVPKEADPHGLHHSCSPSGFWLGLTNRKCQQDITSWTPFATPRAPSLPGCASAGVAFLSLRPRSSQAITLPQLYSSAQGLVQFTSPVLFRRRDGTGFPVLLVLVGSPSLIFSFDPDLTSVISPFTKLPPSLSVPAASCWYSDTYFCSDVKMPTIFLNIMLRLKWDTEVFQIRCPVLKGEFFFFKCRSLTWLKVSDTKMMNPYFFFSVGFGKVFQLLRLAVKRVSCLLIFQSILMKSSRTGWPQIRPSSPHISRLKTPLDKGPHPFASFISKHIC